MGFQIHALPADPFQHLFDMTDKELKACKARRVIADEHPGYPCRVSLEDAEIGETLILVNYAHLDVPSPYAATHAIYVRQFAERALPKVGDVPAVLTRRTLSFRAFDTHGMMCHAEVAPGHEAARILNHMLTDSQVSHVDLHNAAPGCFAARATRA